MTHSDRAALGGSSRIGARSSGAQPGGARTPALGGARAEIRQGRRSRGVRQGNEKEVRTWTSSLKSGCLNQRTREYECIHLSGPILDLKSARYYCKPQNSRQGEDEERTMRKEKRRYSERLSARREIVHGLTLARAPTPDVSEGEETRERAVQIVGETSRCSN